MNKFTVYWLDGKRSVIEGNDIADAFNKAGYGNGAMPAVDWYDNGISHTHWYSKNEKVWVPYTPAKLHHTAITNLGEDSTIAETVKQLLVNHRSLTVEFETKDQLSIGIRWHHFAFGWTEVVEVAFGEYHKGSYDNEDDSDEACHYMAYGTEYFTPNDIDIAIIAFIKRFHGSVYMASGLQTDSLQGIHAKQVKERS